MNNRVRREAVDSALIKIRSLPRYNHLLVFLMKYSSNAPNPLWCNRCFPSPPRCRGKSTPLRHPEKRASRSGVVSTAPHVADVSPSGIQGDARDCSLSSRVDYLVPPRRSFLHGVHFQCKGNAAAITAHHDFQRLLHGNPESRDHHERLLPSPSSTLKLHILAVVQHLGAPGIADLQNVPTGIDFVSDASLA
jgi:hypothetical protein